MSESDNFKNEMARGDINLGFIKRKIQSCLIFQHTANQKSIALADEQGVVQINNMHSGTVLQNLTNEFNKKEISKILYVNKGKLVLIASCIDGNIIFYYNNNVSEIKKEHTGDINCLCQNQEFFAAGGHDNTVTFWKLGGSSLQSKIKLPGKETSDPLGRVSIMDIKFIGQLASDYKSQISYLLVLQNNGHFHICHPNSSKLVQESLIQSHCFNGKFSISKSSNKLNPNGIFVVNEKGTLAETYIFGNEFGLKRSVIKKRLSKYTTKVLEGESSISESCSHNHDSNDSDHSDIIDFSHFSHGDQLKPRSNWIDKFLEKRKRIQQSKKLPISVKK